MSILKRLERVAKFALALIAAAILRRPRASRRTDEASKARRVLLVRIDDRLGEVLLITPLFGILKRQLPGARVDALVHPKTARILSRHPDVDRVFAFDARRLFLGPLAPGIRALRKESYDAIVDCANWTDPSVRSALVSRLIGPRSVVIGPRARPVASLYSIAVDALVGCPSELEQRAHLASPLAKGSGPARLSLPSPQPSPAIGVFLGRLGSSAFAVVNPGGRLDWRRVPPGAFATAARALSASGLRPVITWGPGEASLATAVADLAPGCLLAPPTEIAELAALMHSATLTVCNNTGPMHLSVALGTPTLALFVKVDPRRWGHEYPPHRMVDLSAALDRGDLDSLVRDEVSRFVAQLRLPRPA